MAVIEIEDFYVKRKDDNGSGDYGCDNENQRFKDYQWPNGWLGLCGYRISAGMRYIVAGIDE